MDLEVPNGGGGSDYAFPPAVTLTGGSFVTPATVTAVVSGGVVTRYIVTGGTGYTVLPTITVAAPYATANATATLIGEQVGAIIVPPGGGGGGYTSAPAVFLSGGGYIYPRWLRPPR